MLHTLKTMDMMNSVLIVMNCENSEAVGVYQFHSTDEEIYYAKKISPKEEFRIFRQRVYSARENASSSPHPHHHHHHHPHHHQNPLHDEDSVSLANSFLDDEDSSSESDFSVDSPTSPHYSPSLPDVDADDTLAGTGTNHQTNPIVSSVEIRVSKPKSVWCHGLFSTNATSVSNEFSLIKVLFARSKPSSPSSNGSSKASRDGNADTFSVEDHWSRVNERYNGLSTNAKMKVLTLGSLKI